MIDKDCWMCNTDLKSLSLPREEPDSTAIATLMALHKIFCITKEDEMKSVEKTDTSDTSKKEKKD
jgi:hypothetical protein